MTRSGESWAAAGRCAGPTGDRRNRTSLPAERRLDGWTRDGIPLPHNQPWYDQFIKAGGKSSFEKF